MESLINALRSLMNPGFDSELLIGVHFHPTFEQAIRIVNRKNEGREVLSIFEVDDDLYRRPRAQLKECYCFTKLKVVGNSTKVDRKLQDVPNSPSWKNLDGIKAVVVNNIVIGWVTKLVFHSGKNRPTEWHVLEYRDKKTPDPRRWVLCRIYKREKNNDSGSLNQDQILTGEHMNQDQFPGVVNNPRQFYPSTSQDSTMWANGGSGDMRYPGEDMNQDPFPVVDQYGYTAQFPSCTDSNGGIDKFSGFDLDDFNADLDTSDIDMDKWSEIYDQFRSVL